MDTCKVVYCFSATLVLLTLHVTPISFSDTNSTRISTTEAPPIANRTVSQRDYGGKATEIAPTVTGTASASSVNQLNNKNNNSNVDYANKTTITPTTTGATPTPGVQGWIIATAVSTSVACLLILCCVGAVCVYLCSQENETRCLCCCCKGYYNWKYCREGCRDWFSDCWAYCFSRCECKSGPEATPIVADTETEILEHFQFILIYLPDYQELAMRVKSTDKVRVIKTRVSEVVNVPLEYVNVYKGPNPEESNSLDPDKTFVGNDIYFGTDQKFSVTFFSHSVFVQFADGSLEETYRDPLLTVGNFLDMIDLKSQAARKDMLLIEAQWEGKPLQQELVESDKKTPLYRLRKIKVSVSFQVVLKIIGQNTQKSAKVFPTDTVDALAKHFERAVIFIYEGTQLGSDKKLKDYGLQEGSVVTVGWSVEVSVALGTQSYKYSLLASSVVGGLKQTLAVETGIHRFEQHLIFNNKALSDDKILAEYLTSEMEDEINIILSIKHWIVSVLLPTGTLRTYQVSPNNSVAFLKDQIEADENIPAVRQILQTRSDGVNIDLADDELLCDSLVPSSSVIYLKEQIALKYSSNWTPVSTRWRSLFEELQVSDGNLKEVNNVCFSTKIDRFKIGSGNKTEVFLGIRHDGREVAVKRFPRSMSQNFKNEKGLLTKLDSPNIIRYLDIATDDEFLYLILELGEFTLNEFISTDEYKQNQTNISRDLVEQILESLRTLHTGHNVIHMDIKPQNVLIDVRNRAKLSDFGISVVLPDNQSTCYTSAKGTYHWVAKEILEGTSGKVKYKKCADIQVAGMLVYYTLTGGIHPFMPSGEADVFLCNKNVQDGKHDLSALDDIVGKHLVDWMLQPDPELRPTIEEALAHPFFWNADMRYRFLGMLGDEKEVKESWKQQPHSVTLTLDGLMVSVFNTVPHWKDLLDQTVYDEVAKPMRNGYRSTICGLLRFIRNVDVHLKDQPPAIQASVGNPMTYFTARLPFDELFLKVYQTVRETRLSADDWTVRGSLKEYFPA